MSLPEWQVFSLDNISDPGAHEFCVGEGDWPFRGVVVRWAGEVYAYANSCAHLGHPLNIDPDQFFNPDQTLLICSSHGAVFEPGSGRCVGGPCAGARLRRLECRVADNHIFVRAPSSMRTDDAG